MKNNIQKILTEKNYILEKVMGKDLSGKPQYAYVLVKQALIAEMRKAIKERNVDLSEFGLVVATGNADSPPEGLDEAILNLIKKQG